MEGCTRGNVTVADQMGTNISETCWLFSLQERGIAGWWQLTGARAQGFAMWVSQEPKCSLTSLSKNDHHYYDLLHSTGSGTSNKWPQDKRWCLLKTDLPVEEVGFKEGEWECIISFDSLSQRLIILTVKNACLFFLFGCMLISNRCLILIVQLKNCGEIYKAL